MKKIITFGTVLALTFAAFSFDWPQNNVTEDSYNSYFGQKRGDIISTSLVFSEPAEVKAAENGHVLIVMTEENDDSDFFPSTLGTSVIISHEDNLLSVYGNLNTSSLTIDETSDHNIRSGTVIGQSGNTGWQTNKSNLEFQIIDTNNNTAINPKILMPRSETEIPLKLSGIHLQNKNGKFYDLNKVKNYSSGLYRIYQRRNDIASPYKTSIAINGIVVDQITYDTISQENGKSCVTGKKKYTSQDVYPNDEFQLLGEAMLTPGRAMLSFYSEDILGKTRQINYNISIY